MDAVSWVLARCGEEGIAEAMIPALARCDPFMRGGIRKRVKAIIEDTKKATTIADEAHVMRLAFLRATRRPVQPDDRAGVEQAFAATKTAYPKKKRPFWLASFSILSVLLVLGIAGVVVVLMPSRRDRFADSAVGKAFGEGLTDYVAGVSHRDGDRMEKGKKLLLSKGVKSQAGQAAYDQLDDALARTLKVSEALNPEDANRERERLDAALRGLDLQLTNKKVPAFLDEHVEEGFDGLHIWLLGYYADARVDAMVGNENVHVAWGRRLDNLNLDVGGTVYRSAALESIIVALDEIEGFIATRVIPGLGKNKALPTTSEASAELSARGRAERKAGEKLRGELLTSMGWTEDDGTEVGDLLVQRRDAFSRLRLLGDDMLEPRGLRMSDRIHRALSQRDNAVDAKEILRIDDRLQRGVLLKGFDALVAIEAAIHEMDFVYANAIFHRTLAANAGDLKDPLGKEKLDLRVSADVAGLLLTLAAADKPIAVLCAIAQRGQKSAPNIALFALEKELGSAPTWLRNGSFRDDEEWARAFEDALGRPPAELKRVAGATYTKLFGEAPPTYSRKNR